MWLRTKSFVPRSTPRNMAHHCPTIAARLSEVARLDCPDRGAQLQHVCEVYWAMLDTEHLAAQPHVDDFVALLSQQDDLELAQLVICELRPGAPTPSNHLKGLVQARLRPPTCFDSKVTNEALAESEMHYKEELEKLQDADMYRAGLLLLDRGTLDEKEKEKVQVWLNAAPFKD